MNSSKLAMLPLLLLFLLPFARGNPDARRLYDDLLGDETLYNKNVRPVADHREVTVVKMGIRMTQLNDVDEINQFITTSGWIKQEWHDNYLRWDPKHYGGVESLSVPADMIWRPDIVLFNNADGNFEISILTKAILHFTGHVIWEPPAVYLSGCDIEVQYFPFDEQLCQMDFGSWTYDGTQVDLRHIDAQNEGDYVEIGIDLTEYYISGEWDLMEVPARRKSEPDEDGKPIVGITFDLKLRRKTLYFTVNLILPIVLITLLTSIVFYLPTDCGEKASLCITVMLTITFFFLLIAEFIPTTSLMVPLIGKYLMAVMILVTLSVVVVVVIINLFFRNPLTHRPIPSWMDKLLVQWLPAKMGMVRPSGDDEEEEEERTNVATLEELQGRGLVSTEPLADPRIKKAVEDIAFIAESMKGDDEDGNFCDDWQWLSMVLDRFFLWVFTIAVILGTLVIFLNAPTLYDTSRPITESIVSKVQRRR